MKKYLPTKGFTLIELMVVVTIIAILSVVGISLYTTAQKNARDGIRRAEISSLGKSIESTKDPTASDYQYTSTNFTSDYPQNKPKGTSVGTPLYCVATSATVVPTAPAAAGTDWASTAVCPTVAGVTHATIIDSSGSYNSVAAQNPLNSGIKYWIICARLEVSGAPFCILSNQQ